MPILIGIRLFLCVIFLILTLYSMSKDMDRDTEKFIRYGCLILSVTICILNFATDGIGFMFWLWLFDVFLNIWIVFEMRKKFRERKTLEQTMKIRSGWLIKLTKNLEKSLSSVETNGEYVIAATMVHLLEVSLRDKNGQFFMSDKLEDGSDSNASKD